MVLPSSFLIMCKSTINSIPLVFAITGHRDIANKDIECLKEKVGNVFSEYKTKYPNTDIVLLTALSEGADILVAEVALNNNILVNVILPFEKEKYLEGFEDKDEVVKFNDLISQANNEITLEPKENSGLCYDNLGKYLVNNCNILLALWDGENNSKIGGTSEVVNYMETCAAGGLFDSSHDKLLVIINTPRISNKTRISNLFEIKTQDQDVFTNSIEKIDRLNAEFSNYVDENANKTLIKNAYEYFDGRANELQKKYKSFFLWILISSLISVVSLEIMHVLQVEVFTFVYGLGLIVAFSIYNFLLKKGQIHQDYIHYRAFSEILRVQNIWNHANIKSQNNLNTRENVSNYLHDMGNKFTWLKVAIKNISYIDTTPFTPNKESDDYNHKNWIDDQLVYFENAIKKRKKKLYFWNSIEKFLYRSGLIALLLMFFVFSLEYFQIVEKYGLWFNWHYLILFSGISLITASFIGEKYIKTESYEEEIIDFTTASTYFKKAKYMMEEYNNKGQSQSDLNTIIFDLSLKILKENCRWIILRGSRNIKVDVE